MITIASDGSSYHNGKGDCVAAYGVCADDGYINVGHEFKSTSQRGELLGCVRTLVYARHLLIEEEEPEVALLFDSAYVANALKGRWFSKWARNGWKTSLCDDVKNKDLWEQVLYLIRDIDEDRILIYQIKSHTTLKGKMSMAQCRKSFEKNNGVVPPEDVLIKLIKLNADADALAGGEKDRALHLLGM